MSMVCDHMLPYTHIYSNNSHITLPLGHLITDIYVYIVQMCLVVTHQQLAGLLSLYKIEGIVTRS